MTEDASQLKQRADRLVGSLSSGSLPENEKSQLPNFLESLELLKVDRNLLQTTRIGSSLTKLSKLLEPHCKESGRRVSDIIEKWKEQLRLSASQNPPKKQKTSELDNLNSTSTPVNKSQPLDKLSSQLNHSAPNLTNLDLKGGLTTTPDSRTCLSEVNSSPVGLTHNLSTGNLSEASRDDDLDLPLYSGPVYDEPLRDKALKHLFRCFLLGQDFGPELGKLNELIYEVERNLYEHYVVNLNSQKEYNLQLKCISFNFKDLKNTFFNYKVYSGVIAPSELATMSSLQMASDEKKMERSEILEQSLEACQSDWAIRNIFMTKKSQGQFKCSKCHSRQTTYYQLQTRSSDEPMTTFVTCLNCKNRWRF